jgi:hypothetical protein
MLQTLTPHTLVTRNVKDFAGLGLVLLNPWGDEE